MGRQRDARQRSIIGPIGMANSIATNEKMSGQFFFLFFFLREYLAGSERISSQRGLIDTGCRNCGSARCVARSFVRSFVRAGPSSLNCERGKIFATRLARNEHGITNAVYLYPPTQLYRLSYRVLFKRESDASKHRLQDPQSTIVIDNRQR